MDPMDDGPISRYSVEVHQAAGKVSVQADCPVEQAYALMSDRASVSYSTLDAIALAVLSEWIRFG
jgi:hypothetical protein